MIEAFKAGGWGMYPTAFVGLLLMVVAVLFAIRPHKRRVPLLFCLGFLTILCGLLGTFGGFVSVFKTAAAAESEAQSSKILFIGVSETLLNLLLALALLTLSTIVVTDGALRIWRGKNREDSTGGG